ncbi:23S rRNA pseudouridine2605 synthase [Sphingomonas sp. BE138]|uniref:pseudouridine synthase n=1 Tax=Sphingomonas sp. BE138 TaxID=2817845 RepID=UPI0028603C4A|nr:pseudouridine synthase [Sphingomonas sp. BE138]MDR6789510.1 23S rRNA pseudouridine2605 synthase [Sphingomonas sp. BE138]
MAEDRTQHRIAKLLARAGIASRREVERMIEEGRVAKDGIAIDTPATVLPSLAGVTVDGQPVAAAEPTRLFLFHKPTGVLTAERDPAGRATIYDRLPKDLPRLVPVGRLDLNTEGLLLLTTDGELKRQLELPATGVERSYRARAYGQISQAQLEELIHGIEIDGIRYGAIDANLERRTGANVWIEMTLREGKNREVRRVLEHLGLRVSRLIRTRYGPFVLGDLPVGDIGEVRAADLAAFRHTLKAAARQRPAVPDVAVPGARRGAGRHAAATRPPAEGARGAARTPFGTERRPPAARPPAPSSPRSAAGTRPAAARTTPKPAPKAAAPIAEEPSVTPARPPKIKRQPGWAKPKPKSGPSRSGGPRGRK